MLDIIIKNGKVIDGTGAHSYLGDVGVKDGKIDYSVDEAADEIDAAGNIVAPGFIDIHTHMENYLLKDRSALPRLFQGITLDVVGNCGLAVAPVSDDNTEIWKLYSDCVFGELERGWRTWEEYLSHLESGGIGYNICYLIGHGPVRLDVMGMVAREPDRLEMEAMSEIIRSEMKKGAVGLSFGLTYLPSGFASTDELIELAGVVSEYKGLVNFHQRGWGDAFFESIDEAIRVAREANVRFNVHHLSAFADVIPVEKVLGKFHAARAEGVDISYDFVPINEGGHSLRAHLPIWLRAEVDASGFKERLKDPKVRERLAKDLDGSSQHYAVDIWSGMRVGTVSNKANKGYEGKTFEELAVTEGREKIDILCDLLIDDLDTTIVQPFDSKEEYRSFFKDTLSVLGSDSFLFEGKNCHYMYGTFASVIGDFVRKEKMISLEGAVRKMTSQPASRLGITDRGLLREGFIADIVVFDYDKVKSTSSMYQEGLAEGIEHLLVNGTPVIRDRVYTGELPGEVVRLNRD